MLPLKGVGNLNAITTVGSTAAQIKTFQIGLSTLWQDNKDFLWHSLNIPCLDSFHFSGAARNTVRDK